MMRILATFCALILVTTAAFASSSDEPEPVTMDIDEMLYLGPLSLPLPAFHDAEAHGVTLDDLAATPSLEVTNLRPRLDDRLPLLGGNEARWTRMSVPLTVRGADQATETWLACYLRGDRWQEATLAVEIPDGAHLSVWLDGEAVTLTKADDDLQRGTAPMTIGTHVLVMRAVVPADFDEDWHLSPSLELASDTEPGSLTITLDSRRNTDIRLVLDTPRVQSALASNDGALAAIRVQEITPDGEARQWLEIRRVADGSLVTTWRGSEAGSLQWAPGGAQLSFVLRQDKKADLWLLDVSSGQTTALKRGIENLRGYRWAPDGSFVIYAVGVDAEKDERKIKRVENPADRQGWWRNRSYLMLTTVPDGRSRRLTAGPVSPSSWSIGPDSRKLLFFRSNQDLAGGRPYFSSELWELDLATGAADQLLNDRWIGGAEYGPDPHVLLLQGSPSAFDGLGRNLPDGVQANDYGGQLYLFDRRTDEATPLTKDLVPDVGGFWWSRDDGLIYALCTDTQFRTVYRCNPDRPAWQRLDTGVEYTDQFDLAHAGEVAIARGTSVTTPNKVYVVDLESGEPRLLLDPGAEPWSDVAFGTVTYWRAPLPDGAELDGRIYWPVDYDPARTYPVIVYYYGGTSPVTVDFGGRYPKNVWAGQGYIVYVPEPSGATGYGQEFAARHVNDWGKRTAREVIEATQAFLAAHPAADPERVGCIGASYGGFLTMLLTTQTDLFAAAVSHAGISSIASYWGEGLWGYAYGARALADAFPWSDRDLYVDQSALFHADKINTPLLLVHGDSDTNVPVGESDQLFTALKLLGREVEYVQIQGQDHHILDHDQRIVWNDTILAFFAKWLKDRAGWWEAMYADE